MNTIIKKVKSYWLLMTKIANIKFVVALLLKIEYPSVANYLGETELDDSNFKKGNSLPAGNIWEYHSSTILNELRESPNGFLRKSAISRTLHPNQQELAYLYLKEITEYSLIKHRDLT